MKKTKIKTNVYEVIWDNDINVAGVLRKRMNVFESEETQEIINLVKHGYLRVVV